MTADARMQRGTVIYQWNDGTSAPAAGARAALGEALAEIGVRGEAREDAQLALSELVSNAAEHACGPYEVRLRAAAAEWICEVEDGDVHVPQLPERQAAAPFQAQVQNRGRGLEALLDMLGERGRGLQIVDHLTCGLWGFRRSKAAKVAWFAVPGCAHGLVDARVGSSGVL